MKQATLSTVFKKSRKNPPYLSRSKRKKLLNRLLLEIVVVDYQPFSVVDNSGFVRLINDLYYRYTLPSRITLSNELLPLYYKEAQKNLSDLTENCKVCLFI